MDDLKPGWKTTEFLQKIPLYALAFFAVHQGMTPDTLAQAIEGVKGNFAQYKDIIVLLVALIAPMLDNMHYTYKRTELKKKIGNVLTTLNE